MIHCSLSIFTFVAVSPIFLHALSQPVWAQPDPGLRQKLQEIEGKTAAVTDLTADFEEQTFSALLRKPIISRGKVKVKGDRSRWDTIEPRPLTMLTSPEEVQIYYPSLGTLEVYPVLDYLRPVVVSPIPRLAHIERSFRIQAGVEGSADIINIVLKPAQRQLSRFITEVEVHIEKSTGFARQVEMHGADGDRTVLVFTNVRFNTGLSEADVNFVPPAETKIVRPLAGESAAGKGGVNSGNRK